MKREMYHAHQKCLGTINGISITTGTNNEEVTPKHIHDFDEIVIVLGGSGYQHINSERYFVSMGDVFIVKGEALHYFTDTHNLSLFNIGFQPWVIDYFTPLLQQLPGYHTLFVLEPAYRKQNKFSQKLHLDAANMQLLSGMLHDLSEEFQTIKPGREFIVTSLFMQITGFLCRRHSASTPEGTYGAGACAKIIEYIETNYMETITLEQLSQISGMSKNGIIAMFKRLYGMTPVKYMNNLRLYKACELLKNTDMPISQLAYQCGFADSNYFARVFKEQRGTTPREYRGR